MWSELLLFLENEKAYGMQKGLNNDDDVHNSPLDYELL